jgi:threonine dehydratase
MRPVRMPQPSAGRSEALTGTPRHEPTLCVPLACQVGPHAFVVAREYLDEVVQVDEQDVALAVLRCADHGVGGWSWRG